MRFVGTSVCTAVLQRHLDDERYRQLQNALMLRPEQGPLIKGSGGDHEVRQAEAEQVFLNRPVLFASDLKHSQTEPRFFTLGRPDSGRYLAVVFTARRHRVRVISARPMSRAERRAYGQVEAKSQADS